MFDTRLQHLRELRREMRNTKLLTVRGEVEQEVAVREPSLYGKKVERVIARACVQSVNDSNTHRPIHLRNLWPHGAMHP